MPFRMLVTGAALGLALAAAAPAQELPPEVLQPYAEFQAAASEDRWIDAASAIQSAAEAGDRLNIDGGSRMVLWENAGVAWGRAADPQRSMQALEQALTLARAAGDADVEVRLLYRLFQQSLALRDGAAMMARGEAFEAAVSASGQSYPDFERQVLTLMVAGNEPQSLYWAQRLDANDAGRVSRLQALSRPGDLGDAISRRRQIWSAMIREEWDGALDRTIEALRVLPETGEYVEDARPRLYRMYNTILVEGFRDLGSDGTERLPEDLRPGWCAHMDAEPVATVRVEPNYPGQALEWEDEGSIVVNYSVSSAGELVDYDIEYSGAGAAALATSVERAMRQWRWRPACNPDAGSDRQTQTEFVFEIVD